MTNWKLAVLTLVVLAFSGCPSNQTRTFAGFTYGGGGKTFSAEPATFSAGPEQTTLTCGKEDEPDRVVMTWATSEKTGTEIPIQSASFQVRGQPSSTLQSGMMVVQSVKGNIVHGSFDLDTKTDDGRTLKVVGSFSAERI